MHIFIFIFFCAVVSENKRGHEAGQQASQQASQLTSQAQKGKMPIGRGGFQFEPALCQGRKNRLERVELG